MWHRAEPPVLGRDRSSYPLARYVIRLGFAGPCRAPFARVWTGNAKDECDGSDGWHPPSNPGLKLTRNDSLGFGQRAGRAA